MKMNKKRLSPNYTIIIFLHRSHVGMPNNGERNR